jgi:polar amino acid transport system substrate-binding protein
MRTISLLFIIGCLAFNVKADEKLLLLTEEWTPYNFTLNDEIVGIHTELVVMAVERAGFDYELQILPWQRALRRALKYRNALLFTTNRTAQREQQFKWIGPLVEQDVSFYHLKSRQDIQIRNLSDLEKYSIAVSQGGSIEGYLKENGLKENHNFFTYSGETQGFKMLLSGHVDLLPGSQTSIAYQLNIQQIGEEQLVRAYTLLTTQYYVAINKQTPDDVVNRIQQAYDHLVEQGVREQIMKSYLTPVVSPH